MESIERWVPKPYLGPGAGAAMTGTSPLLAEAAALALATLQAPSPRVQARAIELVQTIQEWQETTLASGRPVRELAQDLAVANAAEALVRCSLQLPPVLQEVPDLDAFADLKETVADLLRVVVDPTRPATRPAMYGHRKVILDAGLATPWPRSPRAILTSSNLLHALEDLAEQAVQAATVVAPSEDMDLAVAWRSAEPRTAAARRRRFPTPTPSRLYSPPSHRDSVNRPSVSRGTWKTAHLARPAVGSHGCPGGRFPGRHAKGPECSFQAYPDSPPTGEIADDHRHRH